MSSEIEYGYGDWFKKLKEPTYYTKKLVHQHVQFPISSWYYDSSYKIETKWVAGINCVF